MTLQPPGISIRLTIGTLSDRTGGNIETIRYYERIGLMPRAARSNGGHRLYGEDHVKRLGFIRRSRELGFTLDQIRTLLRLVDGRRYTCAQVKRVTVEHLEELDRKVADLRAIERVLKDMPPVRWRRRAQVRGDRCALRTAAGYEIEHPGESSGRHCPEVVIEAARSGEEAHRAVLKQAECNV